MWPVVGASCEDLLAGCFARDFGGALFVGVPGFWILFLVILDWFWSPGYHLVSGQVNHVVCLLGVKRGILGPWGSHFPNCD